MSDNKFAISGSDEDNTVPTILPILSGCSEDEDFTLKSKEIKDTIPLIALRNTVLFPGIAIPIVVGRESSLNVIRLAEKQKIMFGAITQINAASESPTGTDLYSIGVVAELIKIIEMPDGMITAIIHGRQRFTLKNVIQENPYLIGEIQLLKDKMPAKRNMKNLLVTCSLIKENCVKMLRAMDENIPQEVISGFEQNNNIRYMLSYAASSINCAIEYKQEIIEISNIMERALLILSLQNMELEVLNLREQIQSKTREELDKQQREYYLNQQLKTIQEELGGGNPGTDTVELREKAKEKKWTESVGAQFEKEVQKLERLHISSPEYSIQLQYCQTILSLPWGVYSEDNFSIPNASKLLDKAHYGLDKVKKRILEHLAVLKLKGDMKAPILCLFGPPGVGKTSLGRSIADSLGREYVRISLGGVHDEAEIRGHRRTYIGAMTGRIIQGIKKAGTSNPVFVLDEIDKINTDFKGDPSSALLEVLDPEQNTAFHDNYLDIDYDLSHVLFIATANDISRISPPLKDRMELVEVSGYINEEKIQIAKRHLIPNVLSDHGITTNQLKIPVKTIEKIIDQYTRESGVRALTKKLSELARKIAIKIVQDEKVNSYSVDVKDLKELLGPPIYNRDKYQGNDYAGVVTGLAWTSVGGEILYVESSLHKGTPFKLTLTGNLGDVMKESAILALNYVRAHFEEFGIDENTVKDKEIHIHVPEGAIPKDGPSAGITIVTSLVSMFKHKKVRANLAMTGEITLRGKVLPVGGIKEKILAAKRSGITDIILCIENKKDIEAIKDIYIKGLHFHYVESIKDVLSIAITDEDANV